MIYCWLHFYLICNRLNVDIQFVVRVIRYVILILHTLHILLSLGQYLAFRPHLHVLLVILVIGAKLAAFLTAKKIRVIKV